MSDGMRPDDEQRSRLLRLRSIDAEFAHTVVESGAVEALTRGCSGATTNHPNIHSRIGGNHGSSSNIWNQHIDEFCQFRRDCEALRLAASSDHESVRLID